MPAEMKYQKFYVVSNTTSNWKKTNYSNYMEETANIVEIKT